MAEPVELNEFLEKDFGMTYTVTCNDCGEEVTNIQEINDAVSVVKDIDVSGISVDDDAVVIVALHECVEDDEDDDDWDDELDDEDED